MVLTSMICMTELLAGETIELQDSTQRNVSDFPRLHTLSGVSLVVCAAGGANKKQHFAIIFNCSTCALISMGNIEDKLYSSFVGFKI